MRHTLSISLLTLAGLFLLAFSTTSQSAEVPCTDGVATVGSGSTAVKYDCLRVDLLSHMTITQLGGDTVDNNAVSDMWGWTDDPNNTPTDLSDDKHYAIVGLYCSTAFVDVTDPVNPVLVGTLPDTTELDGTRECTEAAGSPKPSQAKQSKHDETGKRQGAVWRDIKVENDTAYIVSDHPGAGLQVFDLTQLRSLIPANFPVAFDASFTTQVGNFNAHNIFTYSTNIDSFAVVVGATSGTNVCAGDDAGGPMFFRIDTAVPQLVGKFCADGYTHDIECVVYNGPDSAHANKEICFASNEDTLTIFDASDKANFNGADILSKIGYELVAYTHQGSLDAQQKYFYLGDELDEKNYGLPTRTLVLDVSDLDAPLLATEYLAPVNAIDHNQYVHGDYLYQSNYLAGLRILDIHSREAPYQKAFFDTLQSSNAPLFDGSWSNYRFPNGTVGISDITRGLFMLQPNFITTASADLAVTVDASVDEVEMQTPYTYTVSVANNGPDEATNVFLTLRLSSGGSFDSTSTSDNDCETVNISLMQCRIASIPAGDSVSYNVDAAGFRDTGVSAIAMASADQEDIEGADNVVDTAVLLNPLPPPDDGGGAISLWMLAGLFSMIWVLRSKRHA